MGLFSCFRSGDPLQRTAEAYQWGCVGILALLLPVGFLDLSKEGVLISSSGASAFHQSSEAKKDHAVSKTT